MVVKGYSTAILKDTVDSSSRPALLLFCHLLKAGNESLEETVQASVPKSVEMQLVEMFSIHVLEKQFRELHV